jgi:ABC-type Fe3+/spermidine/putrescine transport system ATPase subunit
VPAVRLERLKKSFGGRPVLDIDALDINDGEFFTLLGPSGCGKTTTLRSIAGLATPDSGRIFIGGRDVTDTPTHARNLGMVFQKYALFPHLTVAANVGYGLSERGVKTGEIQLQVSESLAQVSLPGFEDRFPHQLSGGQQQRVAIARAIVYRPDVLLLDEPLSNLDAKLRVAMRAELKRLQQSLRLTTIFVTHDQHEALALSDRIAVMREGRLEQVDTPRAIYETPRSIYVAEFVGGTNLLKGADGSTMAVKPERITLIGDASRGERGTVESVAYLGSSYSYLVEVRAQTIEVRSIDAVTIDGRPAQAGDAVGVVIDPALSRVFP